MLLLLSAVVIAALGSHTRAGDASAEGDTAIYLVNIYPGSEIYELEGHSAFRIKTPQYDVAVHYGLFSFDKPNFVYRFVKGETDYMVGAQGWYDFVSPYMIAKRRIVQHRLNLGPDEKARLIELLQDNMRPENREYRYNYVLDNCATRPLRMIELAVGDTIAVPEPDGKVAPVLNSFRDYMRYYHANYPWYQFGIDIALGSGIDRPITAREKTFAPVVLETQLPDATYGNQNGRPLVLDSVTFLETPPDFAVLSATPWYLTPLFWSWTVSVLISLYAVWLVFRRKRYPGILAVCLFAVNGLAGLVVAFLVFISVHEATSPNVNLLWLNPLCLIPAVTLWLKSAKKVNLWYFMINFVLLLGVVTAWIVGVQSPNPAFVPLLLTDMLLSSLYIYLYRNRIEK